MTWPLPNDYQVAVQNPAHCFQDADLRAGRAIANPLGLPKVSSGNFAVVFELESGRHRFAVKCFTREVAGQQRRYAAIAAYLAAHPLAALVPFRYLATGIHLQGAAYPLLKMEWVEGQLLHQHIEQRLSEPAALRRLAGQWRALLLDLGRAAIAHGDLQHRNILVSQDRLYLVDYDGAYVPALRGQPPDERGHEHFQHPARARGDYGERLDTFAALVIYLSLLALAAEPALWREYHGGENLIFSRADYAAPGTTALWRRLAGSPDAEVRRLAAILADWCARPAATLPALESALARGSSRMAPADWQRLARALGLGRPATAQPARGRQPRARAAERTAPAAAATMWCPEGHAVQAANFLRYCPRCLEHGQRTALYGWQQAPCGHTVPGRSCYCPECRAPTGW